MAGYLDTKKLIEDTLVGRPAGTMIYPDGHQNFALQMLDYIRSIELLGSSALQGIATPDTVPVQPNNAKVSYIATVPIATTATFLYFYDENGDRIVVTNDDDTVAVVILIWNCLYWSAQVMQIQVSNMGGQYYGFYPSSDDLPNDASAPGYAYVGASEPFAVWNFNGSVWSDSGSTINGISGEPGVGLDDVFSSSPADGTVKFRLSNGDIITIDLNHEHSAYPKYQVCANFGEYDAISPKESNKLYLIPEVAIYLGDTLIISQSNPLPYTPLSYIQTDGTAYIDTGIKGNAPGSAEIKITPVAASAFCYHLGCRAGTARFAPFTQWNSTGEAYDNNLAFSYASSDTQGTAIASSLTNHTPFVAKTVLKNGTQKVSVKQEGGSWVDSPTTATASTVSTELDMTLGACNNDGTINRIAPSGTRYHYVKIYSDDNFTTLVFDGVPCIYNNEYGLWDKVSNTFFGNAAGSGAFSGPSNS